jgi:hypothetical protein
MGTVLIIITVIGSISAIVGVLLGPVRAWLKDRRHKPSLRLQVGDIGFLPDAAGVRRSRVRLEVSNDGEAVADEVEVIVLDTEIPPRVGATRPIRPDTSVERVDLPLCWAGVAPPASTASVAPHATRAVELLHLEEPTHDGTSPAMLLDVVPDTVHLALEYDIPKGEWSVEDLVKSVPGLEGLEEAPAMVRLALRSRDSSEERYTLMINYNGFWPFGAFLPDLMTTHLRTKLVEGDLEHSPSPHRSPAAAPGDSGGGDWADIALPPRSFSNERMASNEAQYERVQEILERHPPPPAP